MNRTFIRKLIFIRLDRISDAACDLPDTPWTKINDIPFHVIDGLQHAACLVLGHTPISTCQNPMHDHCAWCQKLMPGRG